MQGRASPWGRVRRLQQPAPQTAPGLKISGGTCPGAREEPSMPRLQGVDIPNDRPTVISLTYLYGVGSKTARELCHKAGVNPQAHARELGEDEVARIAALLDKDYTVEGQLRRQVSQNISRLRDIACYRGVRHRRGLPVRGQRTRTNARTRKGPKKTVAGKKGVKDLR